MKPFISHSLPYKKLVPPFLVPVPVFSITDPFCKDTDRNFHFDLFAPIWIRIRAVSQGYGTIHYTIIKNGKNYFKNYLLFDKNLLL